MTTPSASTFPKSPISAGPSSSGTSSITPADFAASGRLWSSRAGIREVGHGGSTAGYQTFLARYPDERLSVVVLSNVTSSGPSRLAHEVADIFLEGKIAEPPKPAPVPSNVLRSYTGVYREPSTDAAMKVEVNKEGTALRIGGLEVIAVSPTTFLASEGSRRFVFKPGKPGLLRGSR